MNLLALFTLSSGLTAVDLSAGHDRPKCFLARLYESTGRAIAITPASAFVFALLKC